MYCSENLNPTKQREQNTEKAETPDTESIWIVGKMDNTTLSDTKVEQSIVTESDIDNEVRGDNDVATKEISNSSGFDKKCFRKRKERSNLDREKDCDLDDQRTKKKQSYSCHGCNKEFISEQGFTYHINSICDKISKKPEFKCILCSETFETNEELVSHKKIHVNEQNFFCFTCEVAYSKHLHYLLHMVTHSQDNLQQCKECGKYFTKRMFKIHILTHFDEQLERQQNKKFYKTEKSYRARLESHADEIKCDECGNTCETVQSFEYHMAMHTGVKKYQCLYCGKGFFNEYKRKIHTKRRHTDNNKLFKCDAKQGTPYKAGKLHELKQHIMTSPIPIKEKHYECDICQKEFTSRDSLTSHIRRVHPEKLFHCMDCSFCCKTKHNLKHHIIYKHTNDMQFYCDMCNLGCKTKAILKRHIISMHTDERKFFCDVCKKGFKQQWQLNKHKRQIHTKNLFHCTECSFSCRTNWSLKSHTLHRHTQRKLLYCHVCNKSYKTKHILKSHVLNKHTKEKLFHCDVCKKGFNQIGYLNKHKLHVHTENLFHCTECNKGFKTKTNLKIHIKDIHVQDKLFNCDVCKIGFIRKERLKTHCATKKHKDNMISGKRECKES